MVSPLTTSTVTASLAVLVDDVDAHLARVAATGAAIDHEPTNMPNGVRDV
jgi:predicted enzyme related to lactoylglutathione lyase